MPTMAGTTRRFGELIQVQRDLRAASTMPGRANTISAAELIAPLSAVRMG